MGGLGFEMFDSFHEVFKHHGGQRVDSGKHALEIAFRNRNTCPKVTTGQVRMTFITIPYSLPHHSVLSFLNAFSFRIGARFCAKSLLAKSLRAKKGKSRPIGISSA